MSFLTIRVCKNNILNSLCDLFYDSLGYTSVHFNGLSIDVLVEMNILELKMKFNLNILSTLFK